MRVGSANNLIICACKLRPIVIPRRVGQIIVPPMTWIDMVWHNIHNILQAMTMALFNQAHKVFIRSQSRVNLIEISGCIMMIRIKSVIIIKHRSGPKCSHSKVSNIVEMLNYALDITTLTLMKVSIIHSLYITLYRVIVRIAISKTVGHHKIYSILRAKTLTLSRTLTTFFKFIFNRGCFQRSTQIYLIYACWHIFSIEINKQIIRIFSSFNPRYFQHVIQDSNLATTHPRTIYHNLQFGVIHTSPPRCRLYSFIHFHFF